MELWENFYEKQEFKNMVLNWIHIQNKEFIGCVLKKCDFSESNFSWTVFIDCIFLNCNLSNIKIVNTSFQNIVFEKSKLTGINFSQINTFLFSWSFRNCMIHLCNFNQLDIKESKFIHCTIYETDFINTNLSESDFSESDLQGSKFQNTNLTKVNFFTSINYYIDPVQNKIKWAHFSQYEALSLLRWFEIDIQG